MSLADVYFVILKQFFRIDVDGDQCAKAMFNILTAVFYFLKN